MRIALTLAAGVLFCGLGVGTASAAPAMPAPGVIAGDTVETVRHGGWHRHRGWHHHRTSRYERRARRYNTLRHGNPNARNPERPGYQQQLGNTTNGPRY
ncbi:hypothetical protein [Methylobacterium sp. Leaf118]|uniref:hypothetical protein n=1 Tax=Methylobacterium sp. Leaf118 TaxID=2876562 RepID=UPI001E2D39BA|nr:hypothetical protein [Methylobacterium sp. Leaf118]